MRQAALVLSLALVLGCGGRSSSSGPDDGGTDANNQMQLDAAPADGPQQDGPPQQDVGLQTSDSGSGYVICGSTTCDLTAHEECCITLSGGACVPMSTGCGGAGVTCDGPEDCINASAPVCCAKFSSGGGGVGCLAEASCAGTSDLRLCHGDDDCGGGQKCCGEMSYSGITVKWCQAEADCAGSAGGPGVACGGGTTCDSPQVCCLDFSGGSCTAAASCTAGIPLSCDGPEDCRTDGGTEVCCANINVSGSFSGAAVCVTDGSCTPTGVGGILCHTNADCPTATPTCSAIPMTQIKRCTQ
jgi:hypothetical protein